MDGGLVCFTFTRAIIFRHRDVGVVSFFKERVDFTYRTHVTREAPSPNTIPHHWLCTYGGRRGCQQDIWCSMPASKCQAGFENNSSTWLPTAEEKQVMMATIIGLRFLLGRHVWTDIDYSIPSGHRNGSLLWKKPAGKTSFSVCISVFCSYFCFLPEVFITALTGGYWEKKTHKLISYSHQDKL